VLESTSMTWAIAELLAEHAGRVTVSNPMRTRAIASAKVKTDKIDAKVLAQLGGLPARGVGAGRGHARVAAADRAPLEPGASADPVP
jgi:hypothetical protein